MLTLQAFGTPEMNDVWPNRMKFSILELSMLPFAFLLSFLALSLSNGVVNPRLVVRAGSAINDVRVLESLFNDNIEAREASLATSEQINDWMNDHDSQSIAGVGRGVPTLDPWGRPYVCVSLADAEHPLQFYSTGLDGRSASVGNDPDDLSSWEQSREHYVRMARKQRTWRQATFAIVICPFAFLTIVFFRRRMFVDRNVVGLT